MRKGILAAIALLVLVVTMLVPFIVETAKSEAAAKVPLAPQPHRTELRSFRIVTLAPHQPL